MLKPSLPRVFNNSYTLFQIFAVFRILYAFFWVVLEFLATVFKDNVYSPRQIRRAMELATRNAKTNDKPTSNAYIPYTQTTYGELSRMLAKHNIKIVTLPPRKIFSYLPPVKDVLGLRTPGIYSIPCECGRIFIGQSGRSIQI
jgi:hypothetical protein